MEQLNSTATPARQTPSRDDRDSISQFPTQVYRNRGQITEFGGLLCMLSSFF